MHQRLQLTREVGAVDAEAQTDAGDEILHRAQQIGDRQGREAGVCGSI